MPGSVLPPPKCLTWQNQEPYFVMPRRKLTEKEVAKLRAPTVSGRPEITWDETLAGFGVRCSGKTNTRSYIRHRDPRGGRTRRVTISSVAGTTVEQAREQAGEMLRSMRQGVDPKRKGGGQRTLHQTLEAYLAMHKELKPRSRDI